MQPDYPGLLIIYFMKEQSRLRVIYCRCLLPWHTHCASLPFGGQLVCWGWLWGWLENPFRDNCII